MRVYVASGTSMIPEVREVQRQCLLAGYEVTFDWTGPEGRIEEDWSPFPDAANKHAAKESSAVRRADAVVLIAPAQGRGLGCFIEVGIAIGLGKRVVVVGDIRESVFWYHPGVERTSSVSSALAALESIDRSIPREAAA